MLDKANTTGLLLSKESRLFGMVEYAIFQGEGDVLRCVSDWNSARQLLVETHFDLVMVDESAVVEETFESFCSFIRMVAAESTVCAFFVRSETPDLIQTKEVLKDVLRFVDMNQGKRHFLNELALLKQGAMTSRDAVQQKAQTISLDESTGRVDMELPLMTEGNLQEVSLTRLLYALRFRRLFGKLELIQPNGTSVEFEFAQGRIIHCSKEKFNALFHFYEHTVGTFKVTENPDVNTKLPDNAVEPIDLIWEGVSKHAPVNSMYQAMLPYCSSKMIPTNLYRERRVRYSGIGPLNRLIEACQRYSTLEQAMGEVDYPWDEVLAAAFFAVYTDMLVKQANPLHRMAQVVYPRDVRQQRQRVTDRAKRDTKAFQITSSDLQRVQIEDELRVRAERFEKASPYEILNVWEGCGKKVVNERFYTMVREHHPDTYGGNVSGDTKKYADRVFVLIQKARTELLKKEKEQTRPDPSQARPLPVRTGLGEGSSVVSPRLGMHSSASFNSMATLRTGFADLSSEASTPEVPSPPDLGSEVSDPESRKQRIRELHEKRRRLSSANNLLVTPSIAERSSRFSSPELPSLSKLGSTGTYQTTGGLAGMANQRSSAREMRTDRLERLSNRGQSTHTPAVASSPTYVNATDGVLEEGIAEFEKENWEKAVRLLVLAQRYVTHKKIDAFIAYARYMQDAAYRSTAIAHLKGCATDSEAAFDANRLLGRIYQDSQQWELAKGCYEEALALQADPKIKKQLELVDQKIVESQRSSSILGRWFSKKW